MTELTTPKGRMVHLPKSCTEYRYFNPHAHQRQSNALQDGIIKIGQRHVRISYDPVTGNPVSSAELVDGRITVLHFDARIPCAQLRLLLNSEQVRNDLDALGSGDWDAGQRIANAIADTVNDNAIDWNDEDEAKWHRANRDYCALHDIHVPPAPAASQDEEWVFWISETQKPHPEYGYIPSKVTRNKPGHQPFAGDPKKMQTPWYWGTLETARKTAADKNKAMGYTEDQVMEIVDSSLCASMKEENA